MKGNVRMTCSGNVRGLPVAWSVYTVQPFINITLRPAG